MGAELSAATCNAATDAEAAETELPPTSSQAGHQLLRLRLRAAHRMLVQQKAYSVAVHHALDHGQQAVGTNSRSSTSTSSAGAVNRAALMLVMTMMMTMAVAVVVVVVVVVMVVVVRQPRLTQRLGEQMLQARPPPAAARHHVARHL